MSAARLRIGRTVPADDAFDLPAELIVQTSAVLGIRDSGKTVTATVVVEEALERGYQVVVIDPTDVWYGLKSSGDGTEAGYPVVVLGGAHGDLPLAAGNGAALADFAVDRALPLILSVRHLRKARQRAFVADFAEQLYHRKGEPEHRTPLLVVVDEASKFIPQRVQGDVARVVGAIEDLVRMGRASGFGVCLIDQRPASVNKDVLTQLEVLVAHRVTSPQDRRALREWIKQHDTGDNEDAFLDALASLPTGRAWFWSPALDVFELVQVRMRDTFDSSKTPKLGEAPPAPEKLAEVDLDALREQLEETIAEAAANDPKALRAQIAELERELRTAQKERPAPDPAEVQARVDNAVSATIRQARSVAEAELVAASTSALAAAEDVHVAVESVLRSMEDAVDNASSDDPPAGRAPEGASELKRAGAHRRFGTARVPDPSAEIQSPRAAPDVSADVSAPQARILAELAAFRQVGVDVVDRSVLAVLSGQSPRSSGYANNLGHLRNRRGLIDYPADGQVALTDDGCATIAEAPPIASLEAYWAAWKDKLNGPQGRIMDELVRIYPHVVHRDELAEWTEQSATSSGYANNLGRMRTLGIVDYPRPKHVAATKLLLPEGVR